MKNESADQRKIRERIEAWALAVRSHDLDGVVAHHVKDFVYFDVPAPPEVTVTDLLTVLVRPPLSVTVSVTV